jgi:hypothetical protein
VALTNVGAGSHSGQRPRAGVVQEQQRRVLERLPDRSAIGAELLDDPRVEVVGEPGRNRRLVDALRAGAI